MRVTVDLDAVAAARIERAAKRQQLTPSDFLARAGDDLARRALLEEAIARYEADPDNISVAELAEEYGLWIEEIMQEVWRRTRGAVEDTARSQGRGAQATSRGNPALAEDMFRSAAQTVAELRAAPDLARRAGQGAWLDAAGTVEQAAQVGGGPAIGTKVVTSGGTGGWAELRAVDVADTAPLPEGVDAAALPVAGVTALRALRLPGRE